MACVVQARAPAAPSAAPAPLPAFTPQALPTSQAEPSICSRHPARLTYAYAHMPASCDPLLQHAPSHLFKEHAPPSSTHAPLTRACSTMPACSLPACHACCSNGVDLNRNFPDRFGSPPLALTGLEQPETLAVMNWTLSRQFTASANMHEVWLSTLPCACFVNFKQPACSWQVPARTPSFPRRCSASTAVLCTVSSQPRCFARCTTSKRWLVHSQPSDQLTKGDWPVLSSSSGCRAPWWSTTLLTTPPTAARCTARRRMMQPCGTLQKSTPIATHS